MSTAFAGLVVNDHGQPILPPTSNAEGRAAFFREFFNTAVGKRLAQTGVTADAERRIAEVGQKWYGRDPEITLDRLSAVVTALLDARDPALVPLTVEAPAPAADDRPRDAQGRFLSEFEVYARTASVADMRKRAAIDAAFGTWFRQQYVDQTVTEGAYKIAGAAPERSATQADRLQLEAFVRSYAATSMDKIRRPIAGYVTLSDGTRYTTAEIRAKVEEAAKVGLI